MKYKPSRGFESSFSRISVSMHDWYRCFNFLFTPVKVAFDVNKFSTNTYLVAVLYIYKP